MNCKIQQGDKPNPPVAGQAAVTEKEALEICRRAGAKIYAGCGIVEFPEGHVLTIEQRGALHFLCFEFMWAYEIPEGSPVKRLEAGKRVALETGDGFCFKGSGAFGLASNHGHTTWHATARDALDGVRPIWGSGKNFPPA